MISWSVSLSPTLGSVLTAQSLKPASDSVSPPLSVPALLMLCLSVSLSLPLPLSSYVSLCLSKINKHWGAWVAQLVECPTSAQVMICQFVSSSPMSGSVLTAQSLEPASDSVSPTPSAPPQLVLFLCLKINKC